MTNDILWVIEGHQCGGRARKYLDENHWSNILAWLLNPQGAGPATSSEIASVVCQLAGIDVDFSGDRVSAVERERELREANRYVDLVLTFRSGWELYIENKVDRNYEDVEQLRDEIRALKPTDYLVLLCPRGKKLLRKNTRDLLEGNANFRHVRWLELAERLGEIAAGPGGTDAAARYLEAAISRYWPEREKEDFLCQAETIVEENGWSTFYPDDFKDAFRLRFQDIYQKWVDEHGERGPGGAHMLLTQKLVGLCQKQEAGFRLRKTGNSRKARSDWGFPVIYEYEVLIE